jgi:Major Facilitator Superfamily.
MIKRLNQVLYISFSAFFADLGYQAAISVFPIYLVYILGAPIALYGLAEAINYGIGAIFGFIGGILADKFGAKKMSILGNALIPIMSLIVFTQNYYIAIVLFSWGWWMRNFRTPPRRALMTGVTEENERQEAYGILHALDIAGATIAVAYITISLFFDVDLKLIMLTTIAYLTISTLLLVPVNAIIKKSKIEFTKANKKLFSGIMVATALFGFGYFSFGFPIITVTERTNEPYLGTLSYFVFLIVSSITGYIFGRIKRNEIKMLAFGYFVAAMGSIVFQLFSSLTMLFLASAFLGIAVGIVETLEPTIISKIYPQEGQGMGTLSAFRSIGFFTGNLAMGLLYNLNLAYFYSFLVSIIASLVVILSSK